ncbi:MAG: hypothetical protein ACM3RX_02240 [Methanococcaceae archaeon]
MPDKRENIKIINVDSIILMLILVFGLIICNNSNNNSSVRKRNSVLTELQVTQITGTSCRGLRLQVFQKIFNSDKDIFKLLSIKKCQIHDNKKADQLIALLQTVMNRTEKIQISYFLYHLFPAEKDDVPILS